MKIQTCSNKPLKSKLRRKETKYLVLLSNNQVVIGPEWWAAKHARLTGKRISEMLLTNVRVNRQITTLNKLLENLELDRKNSEFMESNN
jgi:hypothetical protein